MSGTFISPADYPQPWERPTFDELMTCLRKLYIEPPVWSPATSRKTIVENYENSTRFRREVAAYLSTIISNNLRWIEDDDKKEAIWDEAGRRLSERCGRAGMGEITRRWPFENRSSPFELVIREPPITGDSLGLKTWGSSYLMAQLLDQIANGPLAHLFRSNRLVSSLNVLELGSGTGLLGMAAAAMWQTEVVLSDLPDIIANLSFNAEGNRNTIEGFGGSVSSGPLTWGSAEGNDERFSRKNQFDIILVADPLYDDDHPQLLSSAIRDHLMITPDARVVVMVPQRDLTTKRLTSHFRSEMAKGPLPLVVLEEHSLFVHDDWDESEEAAEVMCWWAAFGLQNCLRL
ncbi:putative methyltransferase-domain-containing protein [Xylariaceae sp. FL0016]|nr:putative methyltransferase-domain-containing protein [Xylariaceae sp. FL0016]